MSSSNWSSNSLDSYSSQTRGIGDRDHERQKLEKQILHMKLLQSWNLQLCGKGQEHPEGFLQRLDDCLKSVHMTDKEVFQALPCVLTGLASTWFRNAKSKCKTFENFKKAFKQQYIEEKGDDDILHDFRT